MGNTSNIEWTDATWNPTTGCSKVSAGCKNCYAKRDWARLQHLPAYTGRRFEDVATHEDRLITPLRWQKPRRVFVNSMSDLFHEDIPTAFIDQVWTVMLLSPQHTFQVLTKRPERMQAYLTDSRLYRRVLDIADRQFRSVFQYARNVGISNPSYGSARWIWLGVSVENQDTIGRIEYLTQTPAVVRFVSAEPLLGPLDLRRYLAPWRCAACQWQFWPDQATGEDALQCPCCQADDDQIFEEPWYDRGISRGIDWVIAGGESGPQARPMHISWVRSLRDQCEYTGVPFFFKQWGEWKPGSDFCWDAKTHVVLNNGQHWPGTMTFEDINKHADGRMSDLDAIAMRRVGKKAAGRELDGRTWDGYPLHWSR